jgi:alpha-beta hydrolase superfamily lysophospholipase
MMLRPRMWAVLAIVGCRNDAPVNTSDDAGSSSTGDVTTSESSSTSESSTGPMAPEFCAGAHAVRYDIDVPGVDAYPDNLWTEDADTATGVRLVSPLDAYADDDPTRGFPGVFERMPTLDGFGTTAPVFLRLTGPVDVASLPAAGTETDPTTSPLLFVDLDADPLAFVEYEWRAVTEHDDGGTTLLLHPLRPLRADARHGVVMTRAVTDTDGDCFAPSPTMQSVLLGAAEDPRLARLAGDHADLLDAVRDAGAFAEPTDLVAALVFTTATTTRQSTQIAEAIGSSFPSPTTFESCVPIAGGLDWCTGTIDMVDFTDEDGIVVGTEPVDAYDLRWNAFLPDANGGPYPTIVFGHALTGSSETGYLVAQNLAELGVAVIGIDAPKHGEHPDTAVTHPTFDLLGLSNDLEDPFDPFDARDNFRQATFDKLQLVRRIREGFDVTGDGTPDLDADNLHYVGHSLGAVMGPQLLAHTDAFHATSLIVGGGNLTNIVDEASEFQPLIGLVTQDFELDQRTRLLAITQTVIDGGDPMAYAPYVLRDRIGAFAGRTPHVLMQLALDDTIVPNSSTEYLARSLGVALAGEDHVGMRGLDVATELPVVGNVDGTTAVLWQFATVIGEFGVPVPALHRELQDDPLAYTQRIAFHGAVLEGTTPPVDEPFNP